MNENKLAFATFITLAAVIAGTYLSGYLALVLLQLDTGQLKWNTYPGYFRALDLPELAPYADRIKWSGRIGFGLPAAAWLASFLILKARPKSVHGQACFADRGDPAQHGLLRASAGGARPNK